MTIDNKKVEFTDEKNVLEVIRKMGIDLPTFCYYSELSIYEPVDVYRRDDRGKILPPAPNYPRMG